MTTDAPDETQTRILDAAYSQVMAVGFRRTTLTDVAERAGLSRMTVYRRFPDVDTVLQGLMWREFSTLLDRSRADVGEVPAGRERIVAQAIRGAELISTHELFLRLLDVDPQMLLPYITHRPGRFQDAVAADLARELEQAMADGSVRKDDPKRLARSILLACRGWAFSARDGTRRKQRALALEDLARMIDGLLRPGSD